MPYVIKVRNVHDALPVGMTLLKEEGVERQSRNGPVLQFPQPVFTTFLKPAERVMFHEERDCNPFFHLFESMWMLNGRNDTAFVSDIVSTMRNYSDDGETFNGAYGYRWRKHFGKDQLDIVVKRLRENGDDRRCVIAMWDGSHDLGLDSKDLPCNMIIPVQLDTQGRLAMRVDNRSNDMIWGAYGANAVHFSYLQEYLARRIGVPMGEMHLSSFNMHYYKEVEAAKKCWNIDAKFGQKNPYDYDEVKPYPLMDEGQEDQFDADLATWMSDPADNEKVYSNSFFNQVLVPMYRAFKEYQKRGSDRYDRAFTELQAMTPCDWFDASIEWLERRRKAAEVRKARAMDDGVNYERA